MSISLPTENKKVKSISFCLLIVRNLGWYVVCAPRKSSLTSGTSNYYSKKPKSDIK